MKNRRGLELDLVLSCGVLDKIEDIRLISEENNLDTGSIEMKYKMLKKCNLKTILVLRLLKTKDEIEGSQSYLGVMSVETRDK
ncbi:hypothetical protein Csa_006586 [Cucumis sativus]|uniref:Uncharacterized protein n=1 Tax=Cucumis sativus TaxID=3659 RepID=A0A0A0LIJ0_CUCSA|nr:hypothetical protein Csa_006586 [Cucumis sativus]